MNLQRAERESDWPLQELTCFKMLPYFFAANHFNYSRLGYYYVQSMRRLPEDVMEHFLNGEHTVRFQPGLANAVAHDNGI